MPTYEYACRSCGRHLEVVQSFSDDSLTECPSCEGPLRKVFGSIGITFKGKGFYKTDSRSTASASKNGGEKSSETSEKSDKKAETKAADKGEKGKNEKGKADKSEKSKADSTSSTSTAKSA